MDRKKSGLGRPHEGGRHRRGQNDEIEPEGQKAENGWERTGQEVPVSPLRVRPVGGAAGCLVMLLVSVALSVLLTVGLNLLLRG